MFSEHKLPLENTFLFSKLFLDYVNEAKELTPFYDSHFSKEAFQSYLKKNTFENLNRDVLVRALKVQAGLVENTDVQTINNITLLNNANTFCVTTGHQLCLFTGPMYFIYKIVSTINLASTLNKNFTDKKFVPVYWMASEDHDFEEINHAIIFGKKTTWHSEQKGSVGEFDTEGIQEVIIELKTILGESENAVRLMQLFETAYTKHQNLAGATRFLVNELFAGHGLIIVDGNDKELKKLFKNDFEKDIFNNTAHNTVNEIITKLKTSYSIQVNPRLINTFYKEDQLRERIERDGENFRVVNTNIVFTKKELEEIIENTPEKLSPNVVLRPLYQQHILPNVAYVGGPGEIAYWLEYKNMFTVFSKTFPVLVPRNFVMLVDKNLSAKAKKLNLNTEDLFNDGEALVKQFIKLNNDTDLNDVKENFTALYLQLSEKLSVIDKSLTASVDAEKTKTLNGIAVLEQKINRSIKQKSETDVNQIWGIKEKLFPNNIPQERNDNFAMYYVKYGDNFLKMLFETLIFDFTQTKYTVFTEN